MSDLALLQESVVDESEIDSLGHMNVRFYVMRAANTHVSLLAKVGIEAGEGQVLRRTDTYNRFLKEQFSGAKLGVYGGLIKLESSEGVSGYYEIRNVESDDIAATFIITSNLVDLDSGATVKLEPIATDVFASVETQVPDYGKPRTLDLAAPKPVTLAALTELVPAEVSATNMNGRREGLVLDIDCDEEGRLKEELDPMFVMFRPQPGETLKNMGPPVQRDEEGRRYSFAMMEIRSLSYQRPRIGDTILSMSADVDYGEKWRHTRRWMFEKESGVLLGISDHAAVCMDLDARRAIPIPKDIREEMEQYCLRNYL